MLLYIYTTFIKAKGIAPIKIDGKTTYGPATNEEALSVLRQMSNNSPWNSEETEFFLDHYHKNKPCMDALKKMKEETNDEILTNFLTEVSIKPILSQADNLPNRIVNYSECGASSSDDVIAFVSHVDRIGAQLTKNKLLDNKSFEEQLPGAKEGFDIDVSRYATDSNLEMMDIGIYDDFVLSYVKHLSDTDFFLIQKLNACAQVSEFYTMLAVEHRMALIIGVHQFCYLLYTFHLQGNFSKFLYNLETKLNYCYYKGCLQNIATQYVGSMFYRSLTFGVISIFNSGIRVFVNGYLSKYTGITVSEIPISTIQNTVITNNSTVTTNENTPVRRTSSSNLGPNSGHVMVFVATKCIAVAGGFLGFNPETIWGSSGPSRSTSNSNTSKIKPVKITDINPKK